MNKNRSKKTQFLLFGLCSLIAMAVCAAILVTTVRSIESSSGNVSAEYETQSKTDLTDDTQTLLGYIKTLTEKASGDKFIKANIYTEVSVDDSTVTVSNTDGSENGADKTLLLYVKNKIMPHIDQYYPEDEIGIFGTVNTELPVINFSPDIVAESCFSIGEADEDGNPVYNSDSGELIDGDFYFLTFKLNKNEDISSLFSLDQKDNVTKRFLEDTKDVMTAGSIEISEPELTVKAKVNRITDEIDWIQLEKVYTVSADVTFKGELEAFGKKHITFEYKVTEKAEYSYAGIRFAENSVTVAPDGEIMLSVNAVIENDSEYKVTFASSDNSIVTVDKMGYVKGIEASCTPVTVTVTLEYLGEKFTDECTVTVNDDSNPNG
ncbi:MAG: Ig-like domain-containing protein [Clostridia bacterium]|nr:Ig-like domain-containing protein [Clostridia bacterium]